MPSQPGPVKLVVRGLDDAADARNVLAVKVNDVVVSDQLQFPNNEAPKHKLNTRYQWGWKEETLTIPAKVLRKGINTLLIENLNSCFESQEWNYAVIDEVRFVFPGEVKLTALRDGPAPLFYYGLNEGAEVNAWPAINLSNRICLIEGAPLQTNFFVTLPSEKPLGKGGPLADQKKALSREIVIHLETSGDIEVLTIRGVPVKPETMSGRRHFALPIERLTGLETPHPGQGVAVFLRGGKPFEDATLKAWCSIDGVPYREQIYALRNIRLDPLKNRDELKFDLGIWGGQIPEEKTAMKEYIKAAHDAGFNQLFTGDDQTLNSTLKAAGFKVYPRYGWFAHKFDVKPGLEKFAAVGPDGKAMTNDFCPLAILEQADDPEIGKFFQRARERAEQKDIDGLCVDYETAAVWCYCDGCLAKFREETGHDVKDRSAVADGGPLAEEYREYGRRRNRDILAKVKATIQEVNPALEYHSLASASDIPSYWYDGRAKGRHSVRELTTFADAIYASCYFYEIPGGMKSVLPIIETADAYAHDSGRDVGTYVISPVATTISESSRYRGAWMRPDFTGLLVKLAGLGGAKGVLLFRGDCLDGAYFLACQEALRDLIAARPYIEAGINRSHEVTVTPEEPKERIFETEVAEHLLSRLMWRPSLSYEYDVVQLLADSTGNDRLIAVFNYSHQPLTFHVTVQGLFDPEYTLSEFPSGKLLGKATRLDWESGKQTLEVPARSCRLVKLASLVP